MSILYRRATGLTAELFTTNVENGVQYYTESGGSYTMVGAGDEFDPGEIYYTKISSSNLTTLKDEILTKISRIGTYAEHIWAVLTSEGVPGLIGRKLKDLLADVTGFFASVDNLVGDPNIAQYTVYTYTMDGAGDYTSPVVTVHAGLFGEETSVDSATLDAGYSYDTTHAGYYATGIVNEDGSTVFTVYIKRNYYTLTMSLGDGYLMVNGVRYTVSYDLSLLYGSIVSIGGYRPALEGYTFSRWQGTPFSMPANNVTVTAQYNINTYTARFYQEDGTLWQTTTSRYGQPINVPNDPTKTGYTFTGWDPAIPQTTPASNTDYYMTWNANMYPLTITYVMYDGTTPPEQYVENIPYDSGYSVMPPFVAGYEPDIPVVAGIMNSTSGINITVTYEMAIYTTTWDVDGVLTSEEVLYGYMPVGIPTPEKAGYTFGGWEPRVQPQPAHDVTYTVIWDAAGDTHYTVTVYTMDTSGNYDNGRTTDKTGVTNAYANAASAELVPGFYYDTEHPGYQADGYIAPDGSLALTVYVGRYIRTIHYQVQFLNSDGSAMNVPRDDTSMFPNDVTAYVETPVVAPSVPSQYPGNEDFYFVGWSPYTPTEIPGDDTNFVAQYQTTLKYRFKLNGGTYTYAGDKYDYNSSSDILTISGWAGNTIPTLSVSKQGYIFNSWDPPFTDTIFAFNVDNYHRAIFTTSTPRTSSYRIIVAVYDTSQVDDPQSLSPWKLFDYANSSALSGTTINVWDSSFVNKFVDGTWKNDPAYSAYLQYTFIPQYSVNYAFVQSGRTVTFGSSSGILAADGSSVFVACFEMQKTT